MLHYAHVTVEGQAIHYATEGSGPPLLLIPPPPFDHRAWAPTIPYLAGHFRVIAPDLPGFGGSAQVESDGSPDALIRLAAGLTTALHIVPCCVAGASLGGAIALGLAARYPERVRGVIGVGALGLQRWPATMQARLARAARRVPGLARLALRLTPRLHARWLLGGALGDRSRLSDDLVAQVASGLRERAGRQMTLQLLRHLDDWQFVIRQLGGILAPTLLVWGERDGFYGLPAAERLRHAIPGAQLVTIAGAGHLLPVERPIELAEAMRRFLLSLNPPPQGGARGGRATPAAR